MESSFQPRQASGRQGPSQKVLIVEDDPVAGKYLETALQATSYNPTLVISVEDALNAIDEEFYPLVILDLHLRDSRGEDFIRAMNERPLRPIILVHTVEGDVGRVIAIMKLGVYDYILKPSDKDIIVDRLNKALEVFGLRQMQNRLEQEREVRIRKQLSWNLWKETLVFRNGDRFDQALFTNLDTIVSQGRGFGMLVSMVRDIRTMAKKGPDGISVPEALIKMLEDNAEAADQAILRFREIHQTLKRPPRLNRYSVAQLYAKMQEVVDGMQQLAGLREQTIFISSGGKQESDRFVLLDDAVFAAFREVILNAMKFSRRMSSILVLFKPLSETLEISVVSEPETVDGMVGIPEDLETAVFEPFFRIGRTVDERYGTLDYGLGLTLVDKIIRKHGGRISAFNVKDHLNLEKAGLMRVNLNTELPLLNASSESEVEAESALQRIQAAFDSPGVPYPPTS